MYGSDPTEAGAVAYRTGMAGAQWVATHLGMSTTVHLS